MRFGGDIGTAQAQEVIDYLEEDEDNSANIVLSSNGGDMFIAKRIIGLAAAYKSRITVEMVGLVASAGTALAVSLGEKTYIRETTMAMIHEPTTFTEGGLQEHKNKVEFLEKGLEVHRDIYLRNTNLTESQIDEYLSNEKFFTTKEAIEAGIADELLPANEKVAEVMEKLNSDIDEEDDLFTIAAKYPIAQVAALYSNSSTEVNVDKELEKSLRAEIDSLKDKVSSLESANADLKGKLSDKIKELNAQANNAVLDKAIEEKRIDSKDRVLWLGRLKSGGETVKEILESIEPKVLYFGELGSDQDKPDSAVELGDIPDNIVSDYRQAGFSDEEILAAWNEVS